MIEIRKALDLVEPQHRWRLSLVMVAMLITALLQIAGVVSIMPFIALVADPDLVHRNVWMAQIYESVGIESTNRFLALLGFATILLITSFNAFSAFSHWLSVRFVWEVHDRLSQRLLQKYLHEPYSFYFRRNTADLSKGLLGEVREVVDNVVVPWIEILTRGATVLMFVLLLMVVDPILALFSAGTLGGAYAVIYMSMRKRLAEYGARRHVAYGERFVITGEAFGGIKEVKAMGIENHFLDRFQVSSGRYSRAMTAHSMISKLPHYALEVVAFGGVIGAVVYLVETRGDLAEVIPVVALYVLAGYRLIPALQSLFYSLSHIRFNSAVLTALHDDLFRPSQASPAPASASGSAGSGAGLLLFDREIRFKEVTFEYPGAARTALRNAELVIPAHQTVGLVGRTGSGKSTAVDLLLGLITPTQGEVLVDGIPLTEDNIAAWRRVIGYVPQSIFLSDATIAQNIALGLQEKHIDFGAIERAARAAQLHDFVKTLPRGYQTIVGERGVRLSGGERQRIAIARALYRDPLILVLDEATSALDGATEGSVMQAIQGLSGKKTIIMVTHRLTTVRSCDVIYLFEDGEITARGTFSDLAATNSKFRMMAKGVAGSALNKEMNTQ